MRKSCPLRRAASLILSICVLTLMFNFPTVSAAEASSQVSVPSVYVKQTKYNPCLVQKVYLEPDTEYVFSYLYNNLPASAEVICFTDDEHSHQADKPVLSSKVNRLTHTFKTVSLKTEGVITGTGENANKIESYIGIRMYADKTDIAKNDEKYIDGKCVYGDFQLYRKDDSAKTNLFTNIRKIAGRYDKTGWIGLSDSSYASDNFANYDADPDAPFLQDPTLDFFASTISDRCVKLVSVFKSPYFVQKVWLDPDTDYTFSYCYSKAPATKNIIYKSFSADAAEYNIKSVTEDSTQKTVYCNFTASSLTDSSVVKGTGSNDGKILAVIGLFFSNTDQQLLGGCYADLQLYASNDEHKTNLLLDPRYNSIGTVSNSETWHGITNLSDSSLSIVKTTDISESAFDRYFVIHAADSENGKITLSQSYAFQGESVTANIVPADGYKIKSVTANGNELTGTNGEYSFLPSENTTVSAEFEKVETVPSIHVLHTRYSPHFVQQVWLEPDTEYVFSYLYSNLPASTEALYYTDHNHVFEASDRTCSAQEKRLIRSFKTVSLDAAGVERGTGENADKIKSYIGIRMFYSGDVTQDDTEYTDMKCLYGGFSLYKKSDASKTNIFKNPENPFENIEYEYGTGDWINIDAGATNPAGLNFESCAENSVSKSVYDNDSSSLSIEVMDVTTYRSPYFVRAVWLKPNTTYKFSYMYSAAPANETVAIKDLSENKYTLSAPIYDDVYNKVTYEFTTSDSSDSEVNYNSETGLLETYVGIRFWDSAADLLGTYYGGFTLCEKNDESDTNLLFDTDFSDRGKRSDGKRWNGYFSGNDAALSFGDKSIISNDVYKKSRKITVSSSDNGRLIPETSSAKAGETVFLSAVAYDGCYFKGFSTDFETINTFGKDSAITMPAEDMVITPYFAKICAGDSNGDETVDIRDLVRVKKYSAKDECAIVFENADLDKNKTIDALDITGIRKILLGVKDDSDDVNQAAGGVVNMNQQGGADSAADTMRTAIRSSADCLQYEGTVYYVSENGNDSNRGTSAAAPIKTIDRLKQLTLNAGDTVLFERGGVFRTTTTYNTVSGVKYGAYGSGEKPKIYGSEKNYATSAWVKTEYENIWKLALSKVYDNDPTPGDVGIIVFNQNQLVGTKQYIIEELKSDGYFYYDNDEQAVYLYCSEGNPSTVYSDIEIGRKNVLFVPENNVTIDNLGFFYTGAHAISANPAVCGVKITNCEIAWIGGSSHMDTRFGNGIQFWNGCRNIEISGCYIYQVFDAGITIQGDDLKSVYKNVRIENNLIEYCSWSFEWWSGYENPYYYSLNLCDNGEIGNITVDSNIMRFEGYGWALTTRKPTSIQGPWGVRTYKNISDFVVSNNIFDCPNGLFIEWRQSPHLTAQQGYSMYGNSYYRKAADTNLASNFGTTEECYATNQAELERAVRSFEVNHGTIQWIEQG